ncbi:hypothetical protein EV191_104228 [Tamaricihabitans halophyticus]|uniref:Actinobacteria/chloroflexi VLRF1 release factor domain-containing protein n=1 Tax=Tamaricihabitans halophyticus TaxID=1262583 RepID=A0A4R2QWY6_9PSEU|nr:acVLRF1 family peptidyl-tRNA hydrolase [Tamaricihabitans halophyticus]TCP53659.1 hypothetical protein EV191_104228 [Tamaricihabitans halophyticus]
MSAREVAGGGRAIEVSQERLPGWFERFARRHGGIRHTELAVDTVRVVAEDAASASIAVPFGPLAGEQVGAGPVPGLHIDALLAHLAEPRRIGLLLVRLGGHSVGIATAGEVLRSRTGRRQVHGRNSAGGWSQQRFARRRSEQATKALRACADDVAEVLIPELPELAGVVLGGDRAALDTLREDSRLTGVFALAAPRVLDVPEPRKRVLDEAARRAWCVEIVIVDGPATDG